MASVCLPSDSLLQHLPSYLGFSYLGHRISLHSCSSKAQPLLLTLDEGYLLTAALPDLQRGIAPLGPPAPAQPLLLGHGVGPPRRGLSPQAWGWSSRPPPLASGLGLVLPASASGLRHGVGPPGRRPWPRTWGSSSGQQPLTSFAGCLLLAAAPDLGHGVAPLGGRP